MESKMNAHKTWKTEITKHGSEYYVTNGEYRLYLDDAFSGTPLKFSQEKANKLLSDATKMCKLLNKGTENEKS
jgi:hypothetical protein|tara:strand:- start:309 stop:527 length:219 start_codon:yes stop_codon:yes gene_type:complete